MPTKHPLPSHIAWRSGGVRTLLRALRQAQDAATAPVRAEALRAILDAHARSQGCVRGGEPARWRTAEEWAAYRRENPGYRHDSARHSAAALSLPAKFRRARAVDAAATRWEE